MNLTDYLFNEDPEYFKSNYNKLIKQVGEELIKDNSKIIIKKPFDQIVSIIIQSEFSESEEECMNVVNLMNRYLKKGSLPYYLNEENALDFGANCLISLSFYYKALEERSIRQGAPNPNFYRNLGIGVLARNGMKSVSKHFRLWENFLGEYFPRRILE